MSTIGAAAARCRGCSSSKHRRLHPTATAGPARTGEGRHNRLRAVDGTAWQQVGATVQIRRAGCQLLGSAEVGRGQAGAAALQGMEGSGGAPGRAKGRTSLRPQGGMDSVDAVWPLPPAAAL